MTFHCWVFHFWYSIFGHSRRYCREYPTGNLELGIPAVLYLRCWLFPTRTVVQQLKVCCGIVANLKLNANFAITLNNKVFANSTTIGGLNQFWDAESGSEIRFSLSHRVFD